MRSDRFPISRFLILPGFLVWMTVAGCGQKGPLILPDDPSVMQSTPPDSSDDENGAAPDDDGTAADDDGRQLEDDLS